MERKIRDESDYTADGIEYRPHSMVHKATVEIDPTKLEMLDRFERSQSGHKFSPEDSNVRVIISGRDWSSMSMQIYGSRSTDEAHEHVENIINRITKIGHDAKIVEGPDIANIAVSGDIQKPLNLDELCTKSNIEGIDIEYEPEQFPGAIVKLNSPEVTFLLFSTGKFTIQGLREFSDIESSIKKIQELI